MAGESQDKTRRGDWKPKMAEDLYGFAQWGQGHFTVNARGQVCVHPMGNKRNIALPDIIKEAATLGIRPPFTIRVQDLLRHRVEKLNRAFQSAIAEEDYKGNYRGVFPIKVNQLREVVEEILDAGEPFGYGLEAGSKPELLIALAFSTRKHLLICNGYKDEDYIRLALLGRKLGREVIIVVEQMSEVKRILDLVKETGIEPMIGFRVKLHTAGEGKWATSSGENAKFGLHASEIVTAARKFKQAGLAHCVQLVHFHIGSQVPNILTIKNAVAEAARFYCELHKMGFGMQFLDVGGGLGVDYDGSRTNYESSMNYSMEEYARDIVFNVKNICQQAEIPEPTLVTESGRAVVAPHSILVIEVVDQISKGGYRKSTTAAKKKHRKHPILNDLLHILESAREYGRLERFHDAQQKNEEAQSLFMHGYLSLEERAEAENIFWQVCRDIQASVRAEGYVPDEIEGIDHLLAEQYVCNFSVFQSLLDHWALGQLFPIAPLHRLSEEPTIDATLVDITCDSDGKISAFTDLQEDSRASLPVHPLQPGKPYYIGVFMVGAYQDIMGDLHNLFGRVGEVHVYLEDDEEDDFYVEETIPGFNGDEVLAFVQYKGSDLIRMMKKQIDRATRNDVVKPREGVRLLNFYEGCLKDKTYLGTTQPRKKKRTAAKPRTAN